jgi:glycerol-3-phosphate O-acyltransferase
VKNALKYLSNFIDLKKDVFSPEARISSDYMNIQMLAYYRNNLVHLFLNEAYIATAFKAFGDQAVQAQDVPLRRLWEQTDFLTRALRDEFMVRN